MTKEATPRAQAALTEEALRHVQQVGVQAELISDHADDLVLAADHANGPAPVLLAHEQQRGAAQGHGADTERRVVLHDLEHLAEVEAGVRHHGGDRAAVHGGQRGVVGLEHVGEVEDGPAVAAVQDAGEADALLQWGDEELEDLVVADEARGVVVAGAEGLVLAIRFVAVIVLDRGPVTAVVEEERVARVSALHEPRHALLDVSLAGRVVLAVVEEDAHAVLGEAVAQEVPLHGLHVIVTARELRVRATVVDAHEQGPVLAAGLGVHHREGRVQVHRLAAAELGNLRVLAREDAAHALQQAGPAVLGLLVESLDHRIGAGAARTAGAGVCRQAEGGRVLHVCGGLLVHAAGEHDDVRGHHFRGPRSEGARVFGALARAKTLDRAGVALEGLLLLRRQGAVPHLLRAGPAARGHAHLPGALPELRGHARRRRRRPATGTGFGPQDLGGRLLARSQGHVLQLLAAGLVEDAHALQQPEALIDLGLLCLVPGGQQPGLPRHGHGLAGKLRGICRHGSIAGACARARGRIGWRGSRRRRLALTD
mmetsp:Transcript_19425/g.56385  ORF Transcript_19425/g.56385 Transcript_19425/m.56385 type:complete len:540 (-) Transcript_19425:44-1663(-)